MVNRARYPRLAPCDLAFERGDARFEFVHRKPVDILAHDLRDRIIGPLRKEFVGLHGHSVDPGRAHVNKPIVDKQIYGRKKGRCMAEIPDWMTAIDPEAKGGPEILVPVKRPVPRPGAGQVLIRVAAAGVNRPDVQQRIGAYPPPPGAPSIPGLEVAGEVVAVGDGVLPELVGQAMCALVAGGGYAEYVVAEAALCLPKPEVLTMVEAAALPETLFTVWSNVFERAYIADGDSLLVHGGTSGIGTMAIALGKLFDVEVIVTAGSDEKCAAALDLGAAHAINYKTADFVEEVKRITGGQGVTAVLDMVGGDYLPRNIDCLAVDGRHVSIAVQRGAKAEIPIWKIMQKRLNLTGSTLRPRTVEFKALVADEIAANVWPFAEAGRLRPVIDSTFPLEQAAEAHRRIEADHIGKIVLTMG